jgi:hypothetical protein
LVPLARLAYSISITLEGQTFLMESDLISYVISSFISPVLLLPRSTGISHESMNKCGRALTHIMRDCAPLKDVIKKIIHSHLIAICSNARTISKKLSCDQVLSIFHLHQRYLFT